MHEAEDAYSIRSTWSCYWLDQFLTLAPNILILPIFYLSMVLSTNYFARFSGCLASFVCSCHSILECCVTFSGVKLSIRSFVLLLLLFGSCPVFPSFPSSRALFHDIVRFRIYDQCFQFWKVFHHIFVFHALGVFPER